MLQIGPYKLSSNIVMAPMAGVTDRPFRQLCRRFGAGLAVTEMISADSRLWHTRKSRQRMDHKGECSPRAVQIAGSDPQMMAQAAALNVAQGAEIIDINMGCPAKKVCKKAAGSALMRDERLVGKILRAVVESVVDVPVTLKMRTGWDDKDKNAVTIARIAEQCGIKTLAVHGRTRACGYQSDAEYDTIAVIKQAVSIPVLANGDIDTPEKARQVMEYTDVDGVMIGRAAQGRPWIFNEMDFFLRTGKHLPPKPLIEQFQIVRGHLETLYGFYGEPMGVRIARKHIGWYLKQSRNAEHFRASFNRLETAEDQLLSLQRTFETLIIEEGNAA